MRGFATDGRTSDLPFDAERDVRYFRAERQADIDQFYRVRHRVYAEQLRLEDVRQDGRITDEYDAPGLSHQVVAKYGEHVIGGLRYTVDRGGSSPTEKYFPFRENIPDQATFAGGSWFCVLPEFRKLGVGDLVMLYGYRYAARDGCRYVVIAANPEIVAFLQRHTWRFIGKPNLLHREKREFFPMILDLSDPWLQQRWKELPK